MAYIGAEPVPGQNREVDDISSGFNGNATAFTLQVNSVNVSPESANNILINLGGVLQNPGTDYTIAASTITFTTAPAAGLSFFGLILGAGINTATVADGTIGTSKVVDNSITADKLAHTSVTAGSYTTADITVDAQGRITAAASGTISGAEIADQAVTNAKVNNSAAIAGTKISPDFGSQNIVTTGSISGAAGTFTGDVTIPDTIVHTGDSDTKMRFPAANVISFETAGADRLAIGTNEVVVNDPGNSIDFRVEGDTNANLLFVDASADKIGIGTTSPDQLLHLAAASNPLIRIENTDDALVGDQLVGGIEFEKIDPSGAGVGVVGSVKCRSGSSNGADAYMAFTTSSSSANNQERMRINPAGKVGIGTTSPQAQLQVNDTNPVIAEFYHSDGGTNDESRIALGALSSNIPSQRGVQLAAVNNGAGHDFSIRTSSSHSAGPTEKMKVTSDGTIFLSTNTNTTGGGSGTLYVAGSQMQIFRGNQGDYIVFKTTSNGIVGTIRNDGNTSTQYNTSSDYRLKENQTAISDGITRLKTLKPYRFNWKSDSSRTVDGFFAHEVTAVPEAVSGTKDAIAVQEDVDEGRATNVGDPVYQSIDHSKLVPLLTAALQEAVAKIETLEAKVAALEAA